MGCGGSKDDNSGNNKVKPANKPKQNDKNKKGQQNNKNQKGNDSKDKKGTQNKKDKKGDSDDESGDVPDTVRGYARPSPPKWKKREVFKKAEMEDVEKNASQVTITNDTSFEELASTLTQGLKTQLEKVRALFIWMGYQDIDGQAYPKDTNDKKPLGYMKLISLHKRFHTDFFARLCRAAKLQCVIVRGNCKSVAYEVGDQDVGDLYTSWNAVLVDGSWQIIHPHWCFSGIVGHDSGKWTKIESEGKGTRQKGQATKGVNVRHISDTYFLPHPDEFIYKCIAEQGEWQLIQNPWDLHKFCNVPNFLLNYFTSDYKLKSEHKAILVSENGMCELEFEERENAKSNLTYELFFDEDESKEKLPSKVELPRTVFFETNGNHLRLLIRFHVVGLYKLSIESSRSGPLVNFKLDARETSKSEHMFPVNPPIGFGFGHTASNNGLVAPSHSEGLIVTKRNTTETFKFRLKKKTEIVAKLRHNDVEESDLEKYVEKKVQGKNVSVQVTIPEDAEEGEFALQLYKESESDENNVLNYLLTTRKEDFESSKGQIRKRIQKERARTHLAMALKDKDIGYLHRSIQNFERLKLEDTDGDLKNSKIKLAKLKQEQAKKMELKRLKRNLRKGMKTKNLDDLYNAISEAEECDYPELDALLDKAREIAAELEQKEIDQHKDATLRRQLREATEEKDKNELEEAIAEFKAAHLPDKGDLTKAKRVLVKLYEDEAEVAISEDNTEELQKVVDESETSMAVRELEESDVMNRAKRYLQQEKRLNQYLSPILDLKKSTVAEIRGYRDPMPVTHDVMTATLMTLGDQPRDVATWKKIQKYLNPSGEILRRIEKFRMAMLRERSAERAERLLEKYSTNDVREVSAGVAAFYQWSNNMIEESKNGKDEDNKSERSDHESKERSGGKSKGQSDHKTKGQSDHKSKGRSDHKTKGQSDHKSK